MTDSPAQPKVRLFADFHNADERGRLRLNCHGTMLDITRTGIRLEEDVEVIVYSEELEADARVTFSANEGIWVAEIDWDKIKTTE